MADKPGIPKGTRDFIPLEMSRRNFIFDTIRNIFLTYGYQPIETPAMEQLSSLLGKYGEEGDKLLFKVLNSGDFKKKLTDKDLLSSPAARLGTMISEKGLRYDLTVPFARFVVQHRNEISFPFKRYQIQPVWRADRPQRGRYREFYQCDVDVIGSDSLLNEYELVRIMDEVFKALKVKVVIRVNNRKLLSGLVEAVGATGKMNEVTVAMDKMDKIGMEGVRKELLERGITSASVEKLVPVLRMEGKSGQKLAMLDERIGTTEAGKQGLEEIRQLFSYLESGGPVTSPIDLDVTLARGLNYYTGTIFEVVSTEVKMGSICGGGRYDDLTGIFGMEGVSGVGVSFGADRIYDVLDQLERFPARAAMGTRVLFVNFGEKETRYLLPIIGTVRDAGVSCELYPDAAKMKKQLSYANQRQIPYVALVGESEMEDEVVTLKEMETGRQERLTPVQLLERIR